MIYIRTFAYNAEKTIVRTIESVLSQTVGEFRYYLMDNGSKDSTGDIIREYAQKDNRIIPFYNKVNSSHEENPDFWDFVCTLKDEDYYIALDADDYYEPTFLEELMEFMRVENLDVAACGTEFFDDNTGVILGERVLKNSLVLSDMQSYDVLFPFVHWNLRQVWGKVYSGKIAKTMYGINKPDWWPKGYGGDTANVLTCLKYADRIGVYNKVLHHYRSSQKSISHQWIEGRESSDVILHEKTCEFLMDKTGYISESNQQFLYIVYLNAVKDTLDVLAKAIMPDENKLIICANIFCNQITRLALEADLSLYENQPIIQNQVKGYKKAFLKWSMDVFHKLNGENISRLMDFFSSFNNYLENLLSPQQICELIKEKADVLFEFLLGDYEKALHLLESEKMDTISERDVYLILAQNLSALINDESKYVAYSKQLIHLYICQGDIERAKGELEEWLEILPNDSDFIEMRNRI